MKTIEQIRAENKKQERKDAVVILSGASSAMLFMLAVAAVGTQFGGACALFAAITFCIAAVIGLTC